MCELSMPLQMRRKKARENKEGQIYTGFELEKSIVSFNFNIVLYVRFCEILEFNN